MMNPPIPILNITRAGDGVMEKQQNALWDAQYYRQHS